MLKNKEDLGIQSVVKFTNLKVDGAVVLSDGTRLVVEVKLRMNWLKACQAEYDVDGKRLDLVMLRNEEIQGYPL